ncbi:MAG: helix-turn-helix transcriptional regulator [Oscillospiraceae bacterium]|nr:helix-turn-helix domain-containing protein [Oscillospiraceae bacterium]MDD6356032.1 helix-turn-helix transcriptional regulator [Oscillospiraceae bacterium]
MLKSIVPISIRNDEMYFQRIRDLREDKDLKQSEVAEILGIKQTVYSRYERGYQNIPLEHLLNLADYYDVSTDYILGRTNNPKISK